MIRPMPHNFFRPLLLTAAMVCVAIGGVGGGGGGVARAQYRMDVLPEGAGQDVSIPKVVEKPNAALPLNDEFVRSDGTTVKLGSLFNHGRPVILSLVYFSCPNLCGYTQDALVDAVKDGPRNLSLGRDYDIVVVSIDSDDTPAEAAVKRGHYVDLMNRKPSEPGVTYLTGTEANIKDLADTVGFGFRRNFHGDKYLHATGIFICTPNGHLSQTILGLDYPPDTLHHALAEASNGRIGSGLLMLELCCGALRFNSKTGIYETNPYFWAGTATGIVTIFMLGAFLIYLWRISPKRKVLADGSPIPPTPAH
jgi:protein SCO1/2